MKDVDHNKETGSKIKQLFSSEDEYLENLKKKPKELEEEKKPKKKKKKKTGFGAYKRNGRLYWGWGPGWPTGGQEFNSDNLPSDESSDSASTGDSGGDGGGGE